MSNFIIGTAGHIDHGKTTLIKALSGIATDRLKEEQKRGISIVNGYAYLTYKNDVISIIDVPGHEKFIKNMLSGISGINFVIVVVAADEGIMPQTIEHLDIIELLGINRGIFAITKCDMVDEEFAMVVEEEINDYKSDKIFKDFDVLKVSSHTGEGIEQLKTLIFSEYDNDEEIVHHQYPRLIIDRAFINKGVGSIVTGTLEANDLSIDEDYMIYPFKTDIKIKSIESHDTSLDVAKRNSRVALNINTQKAKRGDVIAPTNSYDTSNSVIIKLNILTKYKEFIKDMDYKFYFGSKELIGKLIHISDDYYEMFFSEDYIFYYGQKGILRCMSPVLTIAGILVIDPFSKRGRKNKLIAVNRLKEIHSFSDRVEYSMLKNPNGITLERLEIELNKILTDKDRDALIERSGLYFTEKSLNKWKNDFKDRLEQFFKENNYSMYIDKELIRSKYYSDISKKIFDVLLRDVLSEKTITLEGSKLYMEGRGVSFSMEDQQLLDKLREDFKDYGYMPPTDRAYSKKEQQLMKYLIENNELIVINNEIVFDKKLYFLLKNGIIEMLKINQSLTIADVKNKFGMTRKYIIPVLEHFDSMGVTVRKDGVRVLKEGVANG